MTETVRVLVATASKHGATAEIGEEVRDVLTGQGHEVDLRSVEEASGVEGYDAFVVGSAVYAGRWRKEARRFLREHAEGFAGRRVWLFSSGPVGDPLFPERDSLDTAELVELTGAVEHHTFPGKLERARLRLGEKAVVSALRAPEGDYRDWEQVRHWAAQIGAALSISRG